MTTSVCGGFHPGEEPVPRRRYGRLAGASHHPDLVTATGSSCGICLWDGIYEHADGWALARVGTAGWRRG